MKNKYVLWVVFISLILFTGFTLFSYQQKKQSDLVIFSYNRPMQLYALLESIEKYMTGLGNVFIIYRASNHLYKKGYTLVSERFPNHYYLQQGINPQSDFRPLTIEALQRSKNSHILFAVDDMIVKDRINLSDCIEALEKYRAYGFYLRLGKNLHYCYPYNNAYQPVPALHEVEGTILKWQFSQSSLDWNYLHTVDMTLYEKSHISSLISSIHFNTPNQLEAKLALLASRYTKQYGLCYTESKVVNVPLNRVQHDWANKHMNFLQPSELLELFLSNKKIDITPLTRIDNQSAHMEYEPTFIARG